uniref:sodium/hydrogen exchanger 9B1-like n=1 Tax=Osmia lignaria TaxID=473952 RepID=UPI0014781409|nr:sodium/hydrogen exchanger 9B1-like [Osmia lignaria]XP_034184732.1 sodium/hydrogen exchanger 9B1-like [Osmia lignaria]
MALWKRDRKEESGEDSEERTDSSRHSKANPDSNFDSDSNSNLDGDSKKLEQDDMTCCHRITVCSPVIRELLVTEPVSRYLGRHVTWAHFFSTTSNMALATIVWAFLYFLLGDTMLPTNDGFGLYVLVIFSSFLGRSLSSIPYLNLPPVFGMLLAGLIVRNTGLFNIQEELGVANTAKIRTFCLTFVAIRAGLQLSTTSLKRNPIFLISLAIIPCTMEMFGVTLFCRYVLFYSWNWSFMTGTILACMSPVVTVNCVLALAERGYGEDKGLAAILCTAACIDNVHMISLFAVCYTNLFSNDQDKSEWWSYIPAGLRDTLLGIGTGLCLGIFFVFFPHRSYKYATSYRIICLVSASLMCTTAMAEISISGGGFLASMVLSFIAITGWKILSDSFDTAPFRQATYILWQLVQPILVGVIGADINFNHWTLSRLSLHLLCILIGLSVRSLTILFASFRSPFTWKERLFVIVCWLPKGTLQAAMAPMAYERVRHRANGRMIELAVDVVKVSVLTMLFLAPIGAILINLTGPILLNKITKEEQRRKRELSYLRILSLQPFSHQSVRKKEIKRRLSGVVTA